MGEDILDELKENYNEEKKLGNDYLAGVIDRAYKEIQNLRRLVQVALNAENTFFQHSDGCFCESCELYWNGLYGQQTK